MELSRLPRRLRRLGPMFVMMEGSSSTRYVASCRRRVEVMVEEECGAACEAGSMASMALLLRRRD